MFEVFGVGFLGVGVQAAEDGFDGAEIVAEKLYGFARWEGELEVRLAPLGGDGLEEVRETLVDALDLRDGTTAVVTRQIGYDAHTYVIYARAGTMWKRIYSGGGAAL